ncbi:MAG: hypothetical protein KKF12_04715 [Proteobacteria bacterium]|nr:hypothetical protein [Desulfobacula sp.]MBU4130102.1 hypothetical protein [Pseudomonadota bacterium]
MTRPKTIMACWLAMVLLATGCSSKNLHFGTYTEFNVAGVEVKNTGNVGLKIGYDRSEVAYVPDNGKNGYSVLGTFDSDIKLFSGYYINEIFATGEAANIAARELAKIPAQMEIDCDQENGGKRAKPLLLSTGTRFGFHTQFSTSEGGATATPFEILLGYKRANYAMVPVNEETDTVRSIYADIVIGEGSRRARAARKTVTPSDDSETLPFNQGIIIKQSIATGCAAQYLAKIPAVQKQLLPLNSLKRSNILAKEIETEINRISAEEVLFEKAKQKLVDLANGALEKQDIKTSDQFIQDMDRSLTDEGKKTLLNYLKTLKKEA